MSAAAGWGRQFASIQCTHNCYSVDAMDKEARASTRGDVGNADDNLSQCATYMYRIQEYEGNAGENLSMYNVCNT